MDLEDWIRSSVDASDQVHQDYSVTSHCGVTKLSYLK